MTQLATAYDTEQENFWAGDFGDAYVDRSKGAHLVAARTHLWSKILARTSSVASVTEFGANVGLNLAALRTLLPDAALKGVEINAKAAADLRTLPGVEVAEGSLLDVAPAEPSDLAFTCTVLIHLNPEMLPRAYDQLAANGRRYVVICEYYNPSPAEVTYRGHAERLFKRDFAGEFMARHSAFRLLDYGFQYHGDPNFPADDFTWFLMART